MQQLQDSFRHSTQPVDREGRNAVDQARRADLCRVAKNPEKPGTVSANPYSLAKNPGRYPQIPIP